MQIAAILLARAIAFFEVLDLAPPGGLLLPDVTRELVLNGLIFKSTRKRMTNGQMKKERNI